MLLMLFSLIVLALPITIIGANFDEEYRLNRMREMCARWVGGAAPAGLWLRLAVYANGFQHTANHWGGNGCAWAWMSCSVALWSPDTMDRRRWKRRRLRLSLSLLPSAQRWPSDLSGPAGPF